MKKKAYSVPELEILRLQVTDVLTDSFTVVPESAKATGGLGEDDEL